MLNIKKLREFKKLTQDEICNITGIKKRTYVDYENEKTDIPLSKLQLIASALDVPITELIDNQNFKQNIVEEHEEIYRKNKDESLLKENYSLLQQQTKMQEEIINFLKEKIEITEEKLKTCENGKKILANNKNVY